MTRGRGRGFTLVELMLVMMIIGILLAILVPAIPAVSSQVRAHQTRVLITAIDLGVEEYKKVYGAYPAQTFSDPVANWTPSDQSSSAFALYYHLQGPQGGGWRTALHKVTADFGPFMESGRGNIIQYGYKYEAPGNNLSEMRPVLADAFDMTIFYFKANMAYPANFNDQYGKNRYHPWAARSKWGGVRNPADNLQMYNYYYSHFRQKMTKSMKGNERYPYHPTSFVVWSAGVDKKFGYWVWDDKYGNYIRDDTLTYTDDIVNF